MFKVNISWVSSFLDVLGLQSCDLLSACLFDWCLAFISDQSPGVTVCLCSYVCLTLWISMSASARPSFLSVVFQLFPSTAWSNECLGLILLFPPPLPPLPPSHASSLFLLCGFFFVYSVFYYYIWFIWFCLPPSPPLPPFCDTASWDRSGRQPRSHTGQSTSHLNQSVSTLWTRPVNPIMLHCRRSVPYSPYRPGHSAAALSSSPPPPSLCQSRIQTTNSFEPQTQKCYALLYLTHCRTNLTAR